MDWLATEEGRNVFQSEGEAAGALKPGHRSFVIQQGRPSGMEIQKCSLFFDGQYHHGYFGERLARAGDSPSSLVIEQVNSRATFRLRNHD
jgi:hypothetical protein